MMARMPELSSRLTSPTLKAEQVVDFFLRQNPFGAVLAAAEVAAAVVDHGGPLQRHRAGEFGLAAAASGGLRRILGIQRHAPFGCDVRPGRLVVARHDSVGFRRFELRLVTERRFP
jgi:hypothetical protein